MAGKTTGERFRCLYCGSTAEAAFGETLAGFRVSIDKLAQIRSSVRDAESLREMFADVVDFEDRNVPVRGIVPAEWRERRRLARTTLHPSLRFANIATRSSNIYFRNELADTAAELNIDDVDFSTMLSANARKFTQACARHIYELLDERGNHRYDGIRYLSRLDVLEWECWAIFTDRLEGHHTPGFHSVIMPDHPDLLSVARSFDLSIEVIAGSRLYLRP